LKFQGAAIGIANSFFRIAVISGETFRSFTIWR
jgi:hypothetical protein